MKLNGISLNIQHEDANVQHKRIEKVSDPHAFGDEHVLTGIETPMRKGAFDLSNEIKIREIKKTFCCNYAYSWA
jgi:hypothetical protein